MIDRNAPTLSGHYNENTALVAWYVVLWANKTGNTGSNSLWYIRQPSG